ncbi:MAG: hypothetical protein QOF38_1880, partial [Pseudonocardiales bacterium]|nr:hypothetical protein [Pseudonocardiales bacterium]
RATEPLVAPMWSASRVEPGNVYTTFM